MAVTPSHNRTNPAHSGLGLKLTPSNSPYLRPSGPKSPSRSTRFGNEPCLSLKSIIGTTTYSSTAFDCLPLARSFAYVAGAAAVLVKLSDQGQVSQQFFRARPTAVPVNAVASVTNPSTPTHSAADFRNRALTPLRDAAVSPMADWADSPSSKTWTARERIKAATCVALSPDGRFLALGETGYNPRVLIFSTAPDALPDTPVAIIGEHTFGVSAVAWSTDSRYLATLGSSQDGYLHVFTVNSRTGTARLHLSNKCTSFVNALVWLSKNALVTAGTRHVKVWRVEEARSISPSKQRVMLESSTPTAPSSPLPKSLSGRNCLLGPLLEAIFTCATRLSDNQAIACSQKGAICLVDDRDGTQRLTKIGHAGFAATCVAIDAECKYLWIGGKDGSCRNFAVEELMASANLSSSPSSHSDSPRSPSTTSLPSLVALAVMGADLLTIDSHRSIRIAPSTEVDASPKPESGVLKLVAHSDAVLGVKVLPQPNGFDCYYLTWSADGTVLLWDSEGKSKGRLEVPLEQLLGDESQVRNELRTMQISPRADFVVAGDRYGVLRIIGGKSRMTEYEAKAHSGEVLDVAIHQTESSTLVASCSRDRTVQLFQKDDASWNLTQTLNDHSGSVCGVLFTNEGEKLLSCSGDRTIVVREMASKQSSDSNHIAFIPVRTLSLKSTPISMTVSTDMAETLIVSTIDRSINEFDISSGRSLATYRTADQDNNDAVVMDALIATKPVVNHKSTSSSSSIVAGVSTTDKSIRVYDRLGSLISREWGHTEGITSLACLNEPERTEFVSTGNDATIMMWEMIWDPISRLPRTEDDVETGVQDGEASPRKEMTAAQVPLRKVLSKAELAAFRRPSEPEVLTPAPTPKRTQSPPRSLRKKTSKYSLNSAKGGGLPSSNPPKNRANTSPALDLDDSSAQNSPLRDRSPSPQSQKPSQRSADGARRPSLEPRARSKSAGPASDFGSINMSTEQVCRTLRAYRRKLNTSSEAVRRDNLQALEHELSLTVKTLADKAVKVEPLNETAMVQLLDQYSARLVELIDEKMSSKPGRQPDDEVGLAKVEEKTGVGIGAGGDG